MLFALENGCGWKIYVIGILILHCYVGASDAPVGSGAAKQVESSASQRSTRAVPKAPTSQSASVSSDGTAPGSQGKGFSLQYFMCVCIYIIYIHQVINNY